VPRWRHQSFLARFVSASAMVPTLWDPVMRRPIDSIAILAAVAIVLVIVVNAIFLQSSMQAPAPVNARSPAAKSDSLKPLITGTPARPIVPMPTPQPMAARRTDPINELIGPSPRIAAVQRALAEYGYGQIKISGSLDDATSAAIAKFEREHNLPPSGRVSDRLVRELTAMVGHPID
jgi:putative peptidoglycan binding protein